MWGSIAGTSELCVNAPVIGLVEWLTSHPESHAARRYGRPQLCLGCLGLRLRSCRGPRLCLSPSRGHRLCPGLCLRLRLRYRYCRSLHLIAGVLHDCVFYFISTSCSTRHRSLHPQSQDTRRDTRRRDTARIINQGPDRASAINLRMSCSFEDSRVLTGPSALPQPPCIK